MGESVAANGKREADDAAEAARKRERSDAEVAARMAQEEDQQVDVEFERFREEDALITEEAVENINAYCREAGEPYVDPQFPPVSRSIYVDETDSTTWHCFACGHRTLLP